MDQQRPHRQGFAITRPQTSSYALPRRERQGAPACSPIPPSCVGIQSHAVAGGLELALWCDLRVAEESAVFGVFCRRWGMPLMDGGTVRLPRLIGQSRALDMILTSRPVSAAEALDWGSPIALYRTDKPGKKLRNSRRKLPNFLKTASRSTGLPSRGSGTYRLNMHSAPNSPQVSKLSSRKAVQARRGSQAAKTAAVRSATFDSANYRMRHTRQALSLT